MRIYIPSPPTGGGKSMEEEERIYIEGVKSKDNIWNNRYENTLL